MKVVIQRVKEANVRIEGELYSEIGHGLLILLGICNEDDLDDVNWLVNKILNLRIFDDENGVMNKSVLDFDGNIMIVSQFTLHAKTKKGNRPSYIEAASPNVAIPLYEKFIESIQKGLGKAIETGKFGAQMQLGLINDGPVTIIIDSKRRE